MWVERERLLGSQRYIIIVVPSGNAKTVAYKAELASGFVMIRSEEL